MFQYDLLHSFATAHLSSAGSSLTSLSSARFAARQYELCAGLADLSAAKEAAADQHIAAANAAVDAAVLRFHRAAPSDAAARVSFHLNVSRLFERTGFDTHALAGLETALMSERTGADRRDVVVR